MRNTKFVQAERLRGWLFDIFYGIAVFVKSDYKCEYLCDLL